jgi:FKBP-type peptidyl-prolyl cis-trans isomerase FklB
MTFGWAKGAALVAAMGLAAATAGCGRDAGAPGQEAAENARAAAFFMTSNAKAEGVQSLPSGVQYKVVTPGPAGGESPDSNDLVRVDYEGTLTDGTVFDSSFQRGQPAVFTLGEVVEGWTEALQHMKVGDEWIVYLPPEKAYGETGRPGIPPNSVLVFRVKLLDIARSPGGGRVAGATANG